MDEDETGEVEAVATNYEYKLNMRSFLYHVRHDKDSRKIALLLMYTHEKSIPNRH
jgi:hypothetical protein